MAKSATANPASILGDATRFADLRQRLFFLIGALVVYRIGTFIPVPGINPDSLAQFFEQQSGTILSMFNMFSGGALERLSIFALGIMPYISASIIMQMATHVVPTLGQWRKEGEAGKRKITQTTRYGTVVLSAFLWPGNLHAVTSGSAWLIAISPANVLRGWGLGSFPLPTYWPFTIRWNNFVQRLTSSIWNGQSGCVMRVALTTSCGNAAASTWLDQRVRLHRLASRWIRHNGISLPKTALLTWGRYFLKGKWIISASSSTETFSCSSKCDTSPPTLPSKTFCTRSRAADFLTFSSLTSG